MARQHLPRADYIAALPRKVSAAGVLYTNDRNEILLLETSYKDGWEIPGGVIESGESPFQAAHREVKEELGTNLPVGRLLCIDYKPATGADGIDSYLVLFDGGVLSSDAIHNIQVDGDEILSFRFVTPRDLPAFVTPNKARRIAMALEARLNETAYYLEQGYLHNNLQETISS